MIKCFLMNKLSNYFYIFSKLTTSFILFLLIFFLGYALYISYQDIDKNSENIDGKFLSLSENIKLNSNKFNEIEESIKKNEILLSQINESLTKYNDEKIFLKLQKNNELLLDQIKIIEGKIKDLSNEKNNITKSIKNRIKRGSDFSKILMDFGSKMEPCWLPKSIKNRCYLQEAIF